jgi:hypothetical protein
VYMSAIIILYSPIHGWKRRDKYLRIIVSVGVIVPINVCNKIKSCIKELLLKLKKERSTEPSFLQSIKVLCEIH